MTAIKCSTVPGVQWNGDRNSSPGDVEVICFPSPPELLSDGELFFEHLIAVVNIARDDWRGDGVELAEHLIVAVNIAGDDWRGDGVDGYGDMDLFPELHEHRAQGVCIGQHGEAKCLLAQQWGIESEIALRTLKRMMQSGVQTFLHPTD